MTEDNQSVDDDVDADVYMLESAAMLARTAFRPAPAPVRCECGSRIELLSEEIARLRTRLGERDWVTGCLLVGLGFLLGRKGKSG